MLTWAQFRDARSDLAEAGRTLFYQHGLGLAYLVTIRPDGGPRLHRISPIVHGDGLYAFIVPSPKQRDLIRDGRHSLQPYPTPEDEDTFYVTGRAVLREDETLRSEVLATVLAELHLDAAWPGYDENKLLRVSSRVLPADADEGPR